MEIPGETVRIMVKRRRPVKEEASNPRNSRKKVDYILMNEARCCEISVYFHRLGSTISHANQCPVRRIHAMAVKK
jgi:hypothetical protein